MDIFSKAQQDHIVNNIYPYFHSQLLDLGCLIHDPARIIINHPHRLISFACFLQVDQLSAITTPSDLAARCDFELSDIHSDENLLRGTMRYVVMLVRYLPICLGLPRCAPGTTDGDDLDLLDSYLNLKGASDRSTTQKGKEDG